MIHQFDTDIAKEYGVNAAIILTHIWFWTEKNEANDQNYFDGSYWTYNSQKAYRKLFPYMSTQQLRTAFKKLIDGGLVKTGNYNEQKYDRTMWYALTENGKCILQKQQIDLLNTTNGFVAGNEPIPDIIPDIIPDNKNTKSTETKKSISDVEKITPRQVVNLFHELCPSYPQCRTISENRSKAIRARLRTHGIDRIQEVFKKAEHSDFLKGKNDRSWCASFDWIMNDNNFCKIFEGKYDNKASMKTEFSDPWAKARQEGF